MLEVSRLPKWFAVGIVLGQWGRVSDPHGDGSDSFRVDVSGRLYEPEPTVRHRVPSRRGWGAQGTTGVEAVAFQRRTADPTGPQGEGK